MITRTARIAIAAFIVAAGATTYVNIASAAIGDKGTCATTGTFSTAGPATCTVLADETVNFEVNSGDGGIGGDGGAGGIGGIGWDGSAMVVPGFGGSGGFGGAGGTGVRIGGSYTNSTGATVTLTLSVGTDGTNGADGFKGPDGTSAPPGGAPQSGSPGLGGQTGAPGADGTLSAISLPGGTVLVQAGGGLGGQGGQGGLGGGGGDLVGVPGVDGIAGADGASGLGGLASPSPLPTDWTLLKEDRPEIVFSGSGVVAPTTTTAAATTTTTTTTTTTVAPTVDTEPDEVLGEIATTGLPKTGTHSVPGSLLALAVLAMGGAFVALARRQNYDTSRR